MAFLFWGKGNNGKSTFRETIFRMFGEYAVAGMAAMLTGDIKPGAASPDMARLKGVRLLAINEMTEGAKINEVRFKYLCGNDTMNARPLYKPPFDFQPTHKTVITTNYKPQVQDTDEGIWRRINLVPFTVQISKEEKIEKFREPSSRPPLLRSSRSRSRIFLSREVRHPAVSYAGTPRVRGKPHRPVCPMQ